MIAASLTRRGAIMFKLLFSTGTIGVGIAVAAFIAWSHSVTPLQATAAPSSINPTGMMATYNAPLASSSQATCLGIAGASFLSKHQPASSDQSALMEARTERVFNHRFDDWNGQRAFRPLPCLINLDRVQLVAEHAFQVGAPTFAWCWNKVFTASRTTRYSIHSRHSFSQFQTGEQVDCSFV